MLENYYLNQETTFKIGGPARYFLRVSNHEEMVEALAFGHKVKAKILVLGGGSNMLVNDAGFDGAVIKFIGKGLEITKEDKDFVTFKVSSGEVWDGVVKFAVENNYGGIENLSHIPGLTGAFVVQNVGAYGQEASEVIESVEALELNTKKVHTFSNKDCKFGYRSSIFNGEKKGKFLITSVVLKLNKNPKLRLDYPDLKKAFDGQTPTLQEVRHTVEEIRDSKFPYPYYQRSKGNAGSFFKNSVLSEEAYSQLEENFKNNLPNYLPRLQEFKEKFAKDGKYKIPTAFLLEACGLRGEQIGGAKINIPQPLVILNESGYATSDDVLKLVQLVREKIHEKTGLHIYTEPELIGFSEKELAGYGFNKDEIARYTV